MKQNDLLKSAQITSTMSSEFKHVNKIVMNYFDLLFKKNRPEDATELLKRFSLMCSPSILDVQPEDELIHIMKQVRKFFEVKEKIPKGDYVYISTIYDSLKNRVKELNAQLN